MLTNHSPRRGFHADAVHLVPSHGEHSREGVSGAISGPLGSTTRRDGEMIPWRDAQQQIGKGWDGGGSEQRACVCVCVCMCVRACLRAHARARVMVADVVVVTVVVAGDGS
jgi:hypothetical protein